MLFLSDAIFLSLAIIYLGDIAVRAYGLSLRTFIRSRWNLFDVFSVLGSLITTVIVLVTGQLNGSASQQAASSAQKVSLLPDCLLFTNGSYHVCRSFWC
jgi:hypothetical protein